MQSQHLSHAAEASADPSRVKHYLAEFGATPAQSLLRKLNEEAARILAALLAGSQASAELLLAQPDWLAWLLEPGHLTHARQDQGLRREVNHWLPDFLQRGEYDAALDCLRKFKTREMLRITARDLARLGSAAEVTREISNVADVCLQTVSRICRQRLAERFGEPCQRAANEAWEPAKFCVLGLGKLGGQELNYSSDATVLFVYSEEGHAFREPPRGGEQTGQGIENREFFHRLAEMFLEEFDKATPHGSLFHIDASLRPESPDGPLARSLPSYDHFYTRFGQTRERLMLVKARPVAGDLELGAEFIETIHPFRYPLAVNEQTWREVAVLKASVDHESARDVEAGPGGLREIEYIAQVLQLLHAGQQPFLQNSFTLAALQKLMRYGLLSEADAEALEEAYVFLRDVEHRLQMEAYRPTHIIPNERAARERLARLMGFETLREFEATRGAHAERVRRIFDRIPTPA
ncbi:MAG TPA: hypothetical protein VHB20_01585 [Verrucomicrobiae bacterium]|jgi:glutamate-ammonia-ligase adenylyltransferase|nr:hypothetical protein [Verrucomicrobiae bacterium]